jgi:competence protein ComEC
MCREEWQARGRVPLIGRLFLAVAAGLLLGTGAAFWWVVAASGILSLAALPRRDLGLVCLGAVLAAAALLGRASGRADHACAKDLVARGSATVRLSEKIVAGGSARGMALGPRCRLTVRVSGNGPASPLGSLLRVEGDISRRGELLLISRASWVLLQRPGPLARLRSWANERIDGLYKAQAPLARALLVADEQAIAPEVRSRFADAGMVHMLSVSGLHVAVLGEATVLLLLALRVPVRAGRRVALILILGFVLMVGAPAPAVRAAVMYTLAVLALELQRPTSPWAILAASGLVPLFDPRAVHAIGFQLTIAGMAGLIASAALAERLGLSEGRGFCARAARQLLATCVASIATAPIVSWHFGRLSLVAPVTNLVAAPLLGVAQPALFLSVATPLAPLAQVLADGAAALLAAIDRIAAIAASLPGAALEFQPSAVPALLSGAAAVAFLVACSSHFWVRPLALAMALAALSIWWPFFPARGGFEVHMLDVGQGDAVALRTPRGRWILVDAGRSWGGGDAGQRVVVPYLRQKGGQVALLVLSHPHADHIGGAASVLSVFRVGAILDAGFVASSDAYLELLLAARARGIPWRQARSGDTLYVDGVRLVVLAPDDSVLAAASGANEASLVLMAEYGAARVLLAGDAEAAEELLLLNRFSGQLAAQVLKVGHHGSRTSSSASFLAAVQPSVALISVGAHNLYGHPSPEVLQSLTSAGAQVLRSDWDGHTVVALAGERLQVRTQDARFAVPLRQPQRAR